MKSILSTIALVAIAINLTIQTLRPATEKGGEKSDQQARYRVVEVVGKIDAIEHSRFFVGRPPGFLIRSGNELQVVDYDPGSLFDVMPTPRLLSIRETGGQRTYSPLRLKEQ